MCLFLDFWWPWCKTINKCIFKRLCAGSWRRELLGCHLDPVRDSCGFDVGFGAGFSDLHWAIGNGRWQLAKGNHPRNLEGRLVAEGQRKSADWRQEPGVAAEAAEHQRVEQQKAAEDQQQQKATRRAAATADMHSKCCRTIAGSIRKSAEIMADAQIGEHVIFCNWMQQMTNTSRFVTFGCQN